MADHPVLSPEPVAEAPLVVPSGIGNVVGLIAAGTLDAELAATIWLLADGRVPIVVAAETVELAAPVREAVVGLLPDDLRQVTLAGENETFDWLPQATELGWPRSDRASRSSPTTGPVRPDTTVLVVPWFGTGEPTAIWGDPARIAVRAATIGYGLVGALAADSLEAVFEALGAPPVSASEDERSRLGVVVVVRSTAPDGTPRIVAAHYVRPVVRDEHGHVQRLGPAVLATWDDTTGRFEHFGWGITPELARRVGRRAGDFEVELDRRRDFLTQQAPAADHAPTP